MADEQKERRQSGGGYCALVGCATSLVAAFGMIPVLMTVLVLVFPGVLMGLMLAFPWHGLQPSEETMLARFHEHRAELDELVRMIEEDEDLNAIDDKGRHGDAELDAARARTYRDLLRTCECIEVERLDQYDVPLVRILIWAGGAAPDGGMYIYYVYAPLGLPDKYCDDHVASMDEIDMGIEPWLKHCWPIEGDWYMMLFY